MSIKLWWLRQKRDWAVSEISSLESKRSFLQPFFVGETASEIRLKENTEKTKIAKSKLEAIEKEIKLTNQGNA